MAKIRWGVGEFEPVLVKIDFCGDRNQERAGLASTQGPKSKIWDLASRLRLASLFHVMERWPHDSGKQGRKGEWKERQ